MSAIIKEIAEHFDAAADLARCNANVARLLTDARNPTFEDDDPRVARSLAAYDDAGLDESEEPVVDYEAIAWAYQKLLAYGIGNTGMDNALMLDRLNLMLLTAEAA